MSPTSLRPRSTAWFRPSLHPVALNILVALFIMAVHNNTFWQRNAAAFGDTLTVVVFGGAVFALTWLIASLFALRWAQKPVLAFLLILGAVTSYYQDTLGATIDREMVQNALTTTVTESKHLITASFVIHVLWAGVLPAALVFWVRITRAPLLRAALIWGASVLGATALCVGLLMTNFATYSVTLRADKQLMKAYQPGAPLSATLRYVRMIQKSQRQPLQPYATDAHTDEEVARATKPILVVIVAGETARAQNWSLGGYARETNPELAKRDIAYFSNVSSCGTATAVSLPCMFSHLGRSEYSYEAGLGSENLLDVLGRAGYHIEWWDNNTGDKQIGARFEVKSLISSTDPRYCADGECTDGIFLDKLADYAKTITQDTVLVLHMIGSHGPAYYLRYPPEFERFTPTCKTAEIKNCSAEEIVNTYDNTILYTDHILASMIDILAQQTAALPALFYASDHGESLGENGLYLHGAPYFVAPEYQTRVPMLMWMADDYAKTFEVDKACIAKRRDEAFSHDNLFSTVLRLTDVHTDTVVPELDITAPCHPDES
ncbi:phosphoethanolamine transferase [Pseudorhodobacter sp. E13]|uniref:phosphoethanolamine transferase n=1 Tax=Pseudorhodobacter sp. E13 TaxID=2487931 RepID=UPI001F3D426D|nr:phosphoethanolamine--lipid A transferase [Pseudorhodobacter sp. E13]